MDRPETAPCDETQQLDETKQKLWTRSRARACPLTVRARLLSARHHSRARGSSSPSTALCACVRVPLPPFHSALATVAASHLKRSFGVSGEERVLGWGPSEGSIRSFSGLLASKNELCTSVQRAFVYLRKPLCRRKPGTCRPGWLASRARGFQQDTIRGTVPPPSFPLFPPPPLQVGSEPLQMMCSDGGERRLEGMGRHKNTHTHTHARTHTLPSPEKPSSVPDLGACPPGDVMTRGEGTCVSSEGTCACARASLLACAKHGASSTTVHKKRWRVFIINEFLDIRFTHPRK